ncbi:uncharacterized protein ISCGN_021396 [Ixodes scapularis]
MAWPMQAAFLCLLLQLSLIEADFKDAVDYIDQVSQAIRLLFLGPMKFYVVGGTFKEDPLLKQDSGITFMCGEVRTATNSQGEFLLERRLYTKRLKGKWLTSMYDMKPEKSTGYKLPNYMEAKIHRGSGRKYAGTIYLLLSDHDSCALFYHKTSGDCELWEMKRPEKDGRPSTFCSRYIRSCNNKTVHYYHKYPECHTK